MDHAQCNNGASAEVPAAGKRAPKIPIPTNYRNASKYVQMAVEQKCNIQPLIERDKHFRAGRTLVGRVLSNMPVIDAIYKQLDLATVEPRLNQWLAKVMISELLFGSGRLVGNSLPVECVKRYEEQLRTLLSGIEANQSSAGQIKEPRFVRINTNELNLEGAKRLLAEEQWILVEENFTDYRSFLERVKNLGDLEYMVDFHFPDMLVFPHSAKSFWAHSQHLPDKFLLQNKACLLPTYLLKPAKKSVVLDMCAAPGLKTTHLACLMKNKGRIYAVEKDATRYSVLCGYTGPFGVIKTIHSDCLELTDAQVPGVEYILLDPSCSGSGMLQRQLVPEPTDEERLYRLAGLQYKLLSHAMNAFPKVRRIVYSTCSLHEEENEGVVQGVLRHNGHFRLLDARNELGKEWLNVGSSEYIGIGERCLYAKTVDDLTIGMFVAVFERCPEGVENEVYLAHEKQKHSYGVIALKLKRLSGKSEPIGEGKLSFKKRKTKYSERCTVEDQSVQDEAQEQSSSQKRKKKYAKDSQEQKGQEDVHEQSNSKKHEKIISEESTVEEQNGLEEVQEQSTSKKHKKKCREESTVEEQNGQDDVQEQSTSKKHRKKCKEESTVQEQNGQEDVQEESTSKKHKKKCKEESTVEEQNGPEEVQEQSTSKKHRKKCKEESTVQEQNGQDDVQEQSTSKKHKKKCKEESTLQEQNGQDDVQEQPNSKKYKKIISEESTVEEQNDAEEAQEISSPKKRKKKCREESTVEEQNVQELQEKTSKKHKKKCPEENPAEEQHVQEEGQKKLRSKKRKHNL